MVWKIYRDIWKFESGKVQNFEMENVFPWYVTLPLLSNNNYLLKYLQFTAL